jgi:integrase
LPISPCLASWSAAKKERPGSTTFARPMAGNVTGWTEASARAEAQILLGGIHKGESPAAARLKAKGMPAFESWVKTFIEQRRGVIKDSTLYNYERFLGNYIAQKADHAAARQAPCLGNIKLDQITREQISALHRRLQSKPRAANHLISMLSAVFEEARAAKLLAKDAENPAKGIKRFKERKRERYLTGKEISRIGEAFQEVEKHGTGQFAIAAIRLLILTGARKNEVLKARWSWVDLDRGFINLPDSKTGSKAVYLGPDPCEPCPGSRETRMSFQARMKATISRRSNTFGNGYAR